jgi:hypothetical protein
VRDIRVRDETRPAQWLELQRDALRWIASERDSWWDGQDGGEPTLNLPRLIADTGLDDSTVYRIASHAKRGGRISLRTDTVAQLVRIGASEHNIEDHEAFGRIFRIHDPARERVLAAAA